MQRKYYFIIIGLFFLLSCFFAFGVVKRIIKHRRLSRKLESILSFTQSKIIDSCTIREIVYSADFDFYKMPENINTIKTETIKDVNANDAQILSERFASAARKYQLRIIPGIIELAYKYKIAFKGQDLIWHIQFHRFANESCVEYRVKEPFPFRRVTIILNSKAAIELLPLLRSALKDANDVN